MDRRTFMERLVKVPAVIGLGGLVGSSLTDKPAVVFEPVQDMKHSRAEVTGTGTMDDPLVFFNPFPHITFDKPMPLISHIGDLYCDTNTWTFYRYNENDGWVPI